MAYCVSSFGENDCFNTFSNCRLKADKIMRAMSVWNDVDSAAGWDGEISLKGLFVPNCGKHIVFRV